MKTEERRLLEEALQQLQTHDDSGLERLVCSPELKRRIDGCWELKVLRSAVFSDDHRDLDLRVKLIRLLEGALK